MKRYILLCILAGICLWQHEAAAFWGSNEATDSVSGLNVAAGFDVNTITTLTGTVLTPPERKAQGQEQHAMMTITTTQGAITVVLGPWWYWEKQRFTMATNQEVAITGSLAQGKDGMLYLFAQRLENRNSGEMLILRSETGKPLWSRSGAGNQGGTRGDGSGARSGSGNRGSGMRGGRR